MRRQVFLTGRSEPMANWLEAFPDAEVLAYPKPGQLLVATPGSAVVWAHFKHGLDGAGELIRALSLVAPGCPILVLSNVPSEEEGVLVLEAGAAGYTNALATPELLRQIETVIENGGLWVGPELMHRLMAALAAHAHKHETHCLDRLSPREREVALAVANGASNKEIARGMDITERTVKAHLSAIFEQLGVRDRLQLSILVNGVPSPSTPPRADSDPNPR